MKVFYLLLLPLRTLHSFGSEQERAEFADAAAYHGCIPLLLAAETISGETPVNDRKGP